jgi:hypothetical protein
MNDKDREQAALLADMLWAESVVRGGKEVSTS